MQVLSLMLGQAGLHLHTFPEVAFRLDRWTMQGYPCVLDKTPNRQLDIHVCPPAHGLGRSAATLPTRHACRVHCNAAPGLACCVPSTPQAVCALGDMTTALVHALHVHESLMLDSASSCVLDLAGLCVPVAATP